MDHPHILRFAVHFALFLEPLGFSIPKEQVTHVMVGHIRHLIASGKRSLIALYTQFLPFDLQIQLYSEFLKGFFLKMFYLSIDE
jgi:hypothetical protein